MCIYILSYIHSNIQCMTYIYCIYTFKFIYTYTHTIIHHTYIHVCTYVYARIHGYICMHTSVFDKLIWRTIGPKSFLIAFGTAQFSLNWLKMYSQWHIHTLAIFEPIWPILQNVSKIVMHTYNIYIYNSHIIYMYNLYIHVHNTQHTYTFMYTYVHIWMHAYNTHLHCTILILLMYVCL